MDRNCVKIDISSFIQEFLISSANITELYIDEDNFEEITEFIKSKQDNFRRILFEIVNNRYNKELYRKEKYGLTAMKFRSKNRNSRIYCKEFHKEGKKIVMIELLVHKSTQKIDKKLGNKLKAINSYNYTLN